MSTSLRRDLQAVGAPRGPDPALSRRGAVGDSETAALVSSILIVDDHPANLLALEGILEPLAQRIIRASSGEEALRRLLDGDFAVILMDVQMPGLDGLQTAALIKTRERSRHTPVIFLTAINKDSSYIFKGYAQGAVDYLVKPFDPDILRSKVSVFVELWKRGQQIAQKDALLLERELDAAQRASEYRYQSLTNAMPLLLWATDENGKVYLRNRAYWDYTGLPRDKHDDAAAISVVHPDDRGRVEANREARLLQGDPVTLEYRIREAATGEYRWFQVSIVPERDASGRNAGWIATATDIHDLKSAQAAKDEFLAAASHELRTPLAAAKAQAQLALRKLRDEPDSAPKRSLTAISGQIDRMAKLVENLLDISRIEAGRLSLEIESFDLAPTVRDLVDRMQATTTLHQLVVVGDASLPVDADRDRIEQVVSNLLSNAIRYSPKGGKITIALREDEDHACLSVEDQGVGIPAAALSMIFERFGRAHGSKYGGLGLGLTISQGIVDQHGGTISVESAGEPGLGTTFTVRLPRKAAPPTVPTPAP